MTVQPLTEVVGVRLSPDLRQQLEALAQADDRRPSQMLRVLIKRAVRDVDPKPAAQQAQRAEGESDE